MVKINVQASLAAVLPLLVVHSSGPNLLGRNWIKALRYSVPQLQALAVSESSDYADADLSQLKEEFSSLFAPGFAKLHMQSATFRGPPVSFVGHVHVLYRILSYPITIPNTKTYACDAKL